MSSVRVYYEFYWILEAQGSKLQVMVTSLGVLQMVCRLVGDGLSRLLYLAEDGQASIPL
jgi:hypothetical protein